MFSNSQKIFCQFSLFSLCWFSGCAIEPQKEKPATNLIQTEESSLQKEHKVLSLSSLSDKIVMKTFDKKVVANSQYILDYNSQRLKIYQADTMKFLHSIEGFACQHPPVFINDFECIAINDKKLVLIDLRDQTVQPISFIEGPVLSKPLVIQNEYIVLQYTNNIAQCFNFKGDSLWKTLLPFSSSHYKNSYYAPCADLTHIYLAYPGGPLCKLSLSTGLIEWTSKAIIGDNTQANGFFISHINQPLRTYNNLIIAQTSDNKLYLLDAYRGDIVTSIDVTKNSAYAQKDEKLFFIDPSGALCAYNLENNTLAWQEFVGTDGRVLGFLGTENPLLLIRNQEGQLLSLNPSEGQKHFCFNQLPKNYDFFATESAVYGQDKQGSLIAFNFSDLSY